MSNNLAGYEFIQTVGKGAMGSVYLARQTALNRFVAIKQVLGAWNGDPQALERFRREARALAKMNHPNIVGIYNLEAAGSDLYMIQEYVHGATLKQLLSNGRLSTGQSMRVIGEVSAALEYAAKQGILHRDLKPGNLFITTTGVCKLGDFGLVKMIGGQSAFVTQVGTILGTPSYMSPEQAAGKADMDARTDVYSLAVMTYELLVGRLPFPPVPGNVMATVEAHISQAPPKPSQLVAGFPSKVEDVLLGALAKDPKKRPKSAGEFWVKLADAAQRAWPGWADQSDLSALAAAAAPPAPVASPVAPVTPPAIAAESAAAAAASATATGDITVPSGPPPALSPQQWTISPLDNTAFMAGGDETVVRPTADMAADETVALPGVPASDETMVQGAPPPMDETLVMGGGAGDETVVRPPAPMPPQSIHAGQPTGAPAFVPGPPPPPAAPASATFSVPQVAAPVYKPPKPPRRKGRLRRLLLPLVVLVIIGAAGFYFVTRNGGPALLATAAEASVQPPKGGGHCPKATYLFVGKIRTNGGAGTIKYQWTQPDGSAAQPTEQLVAKGDGVITVTLSFTYTGDGSTDGDAFLTVLSPNKVDSNHVAVQYRCP
ncbi:MAG: eukaryotic-like serine/threonine-protein kinase [Chloroflexota bacterium]|nr:eukaryotic-like serine/threonine-protein kinase [Chloroflexota bacterium]